MRMARTGQSQEIQPRGAGNESAGSEVREKPGITQCLDWVTGWMVVVLDETEMEGTLEEKRMS